MGKRWQMRTPPYIILLIRTFLTLEGVVGKVDPNFNVYTAALRKWWESGGKWNARVGRRGPALLNLCYRTNFTPHMYFVPFLCLHNFPSYGVMPTKQLFYLFVLAWAIQRALSPST